jgi:hypothetical protein
VAAAIQSMRVSFEVGAPNEDGERATVKVVDVKFCDKLAAIKQLAEHLGLRKDAGTTHNTLILNWGSMFGEGVPEPPDTVAAKILALEAELGALPPPTDVPAPPDYLTTPREDTPTSPQGNHGGNGNGVPRNGVPYD